MGFWDWAKDVILKELKKKYNVPAIINAIRQAESKGQVAFYPASKYSRMILKEILASAPDLAPRIYGCFDKSPLASSAPGIPVYTLDRLNEAKSAISLLIVASSTYYSRQLSDIRTLTSYEGPILTTSYFDYSLPPLTPEELMAEIEATTAMLKDGKSRMTYLLTWLSRVLNDEEVTSIFESENEITPLENGVINFKGLRIHGITDPEINKELFSDVYGMKGIRPAPGDVLLDVGAFKGETAIVFADMVHRRGKVYAFEPITAAYQQMVDNIAANKLQDIVIPVNKGCSSTVSKAKAVSTAAGAPWTFIGDEDGAIEVDLTSIDDFVAGQGLNRVDFIKVDVEGFEEDVIKGAEKVIRTMRPKMAIALYHKSVDLTSLPRLVRSMADYDLYVRSNMDGPYGLNLFCR